MSDKGQKIFKIIVWILIVLGIAFAVYSKINSIMNPSITQTEWKMMLAERFGDERLLELDENAEYATGEYAAVTIMKAIGNSNLQFMIGEMDCNDDELLALALEKGMVTKKQLKDSITKIEAQEILDNAMDFYFNLDEYPEYYDVDYVCDVVDANEWTIISFDEENDILYATDLPSLPTVGQVILPKNEFGIAKPRYIKECRELENGQYEMILEKMSDPSQLYSDISFSGRADFSYLLNASEGSSAETQNADIGDGENEKNRFVNAFSPITVYAAKTKTFASKADIETGGTVTAKVKSSGSNAYSYNSYLKIKDEESESKYAITVDNKGKLQLEVVRNDVTLEAEHEANKVDKDDKFEAEASASNSFTYKVKLTDLQIAASYCTKGNNNEKFIDVRVISDVDLEWSIKGKFEGKIPVAEVEVPVYCTMGLVSVNLRLYLVVDASGEVTLVYEMDDVSVGVRVSEDGLSTPHSRNKDADKLDINAKVSVGIGFCGEVAISIGDWLDIVEYDIIDPGIEVKFVTSAETLQNNEGFENYPKCVQMKMAAPTVAFELSAGEDSLIYALLDLFNLTAKTSYEFITEDNAPFKKDYHIETELDGTTNVIEGSKDYCTHIMPEETELIIEDPIEAAKKRAEEAAQKKAEEARKKAQEAFEKALEEAVEKWIVENCGGC